MGFRNLQYIGFIPTVITIKRIFTCFHLSTMNASCTHKNVSQIPCDFLMRREKWFAFKQMTLLTYATKHFQILRSAWAKSVIVSRLNSLRMGRLSSSMVWWLVVTKKVSLWRSPTISASWINVMSITQLSQTLSFSEPVVHILQLSAHQM